jgi:hypothetical protein
MAIHRQFARMVRPAMPAMLLYFACQAVAIAVLTLMSWAVDLSPGYFVGHWDSAWYSEVAEHGYRFPVQVDAHGVPGQNSLAFFPLYPTLMAVVLAVGLPVLWAGLLVTLVAGGVAAWGLFVLGRDLAGPRVGTVLAALWASVPGASALHLVYSESVLVALAVWTLVLLLRREWLPAAGLAVLAGLTRAIAVALIIALVVAAIRAIVRRQDGWRPWAAILIAPLGLAAYLGYVAWRTSRLDGWFWLEKAWQMRFDWGRFTMDRIVPGLTGDSTWLTLTTLIVLGSVVLTMWSATTRMPLILHVYGFLVVVIALTSANFFQSRPRFLLPAFTILLPLALLLAKLPARVLAILLPTGALAGAWYGAYLMTVAHMNP